MSLGRASAAPPIDRPAIVLLMVWCCVGFWVGLERTASAAGIDAFVAKHCNDCHAGEKPAQNLRLDTLTQSPSEADDLAVWKQVYAQLESGRMPPEEVSQPSLAERLEALKWIRTTLAAAGSPVDESRGRSSANGNWVDHNFLFSGQSLGDSATPSRVWRISDNAYSALIERLKGGAIRTLKDLTPPWRLQPAWSFPDYSSAHRVGEAELEMHLRTCQRLVSHLLKDGRFKTKRNEALFQVIGLGAKAPAPKLNAAVVNAFELILGRRPDPEETARYAAFLAEVLKEDGGEAGMEQFLMAVLSHPSVLYRLERPAAGTKRGMLRPEELARAISFALTDQEPDSTLAAAATQGKLKTVAEVRQQVERILADSKIEKLQVVRFFRDYFGYETGPDVFKDEPTLRANGIGLWAPKFFVTDANRLVRWVLERDRDVLKELLTTNKTFALTFDPRHFDQLAYYTNTRFGSPKTPPETPFKKVGAERSTLDIYELDLQTRGDWSPDVPYDMPAEHRMGLLTHPAWLVAHSANFDNHVIHRGRWIRERLLGGVIPDVPITVNAMLPDEPHRALRDRMEVTRESYCWNCHKLMDPLGFPFEQFDHFGRFRTEELVVDREATEELLQRRRSNMQRKGRELSQAQAGVILYKRVPFDASGEVEGALDPALNGPVRGPFELIQKLANSRFVEQVFVRHAFRFFLGRNETYADGPTLVAAHEAYVNNGGSMRALITSLLTSNAFLMRSAPTSPSRNGTPSGSDR